MAQELVFTPLGPIFINETGTNQEGIGGVFINETMTATAIAVNIVPMIFVCT